MRKQNDATRKSLRKFRRLTASTLVAAVVIMAIGAITVLSRQRADAERKAQMANKTEFVKSQHAAQDQAVNSESQAQELTPEEAQKLAAGMKELVNQSTDGLVEVQHSDGSVSVDLQGRFQNVTVARVNKDGSISQSCVDNPRSAGAFFGIDPKLIDDKTESTGAKPAKVPAKSRN